MRWRYLVLILVALATFQCGCSSQRPTTNKVVAITNFRQIPGVTQEEIAAIEHLAKTRKSFSYGVALSNESFYDGEGQVDGFAHLLSKHFSTLLGIEFVPEINSWENLNKKLDSKELDFTAELSPSHERRQKYFMTDPLINRTIKIYTNKNFPPLSELAKMHPVRLAFLEGSTTVDFVRDTWDFPVETLFVKDEADLVDLLSRGIIDAFVEESAISAIFEDADFILASDYYPLRYSPISLTTADPELEPVIQVIQKYLRNGGINEVIALYKQGEQRYARHKLFKQFTEEERAYIRSHNTFEHGVRVGMERDNYPTGFFNRQKKEFQGITLDVLKEITDLTGLEFKVANSPEVSWEELLTQLETGKIAMVSNLTPTKNRAGRFIWVNEPQDSDHYLLLSREDYPNIDSNQIMYVKVGLVENTAAKETFQNWFPVSVNDVIYPDYSTAFAALEKGEIDLLMGTQSVLLTLTNYLEKTDYKANVIFNYPAISALGLNKNETVLRSILDKSIPLTNYVNISERWRSKVFDYSSKMLKDIMPYMLGAILLLIMGFGSALFLLYKNRQLNKNLESIVEQRTRALEHASRAKSDFLSSMSHEIRTPMNAIIGMSQIAAGTNDMPRLKSCLDTISASSKHLLRLINDILDMSKIEAGKLEISEALFDLENILMQVCNMMQDATEQKKQTLRFDFDKAMHMNYIGDELRLSQVIVNLLSNAVKFTPEGGAITLSVHEESQEDGHSILHFSVADTGIGMTPEQMKRLFNTFSQADEGIAKRFGGTGLGLAISRNIVEKMHGRIWVESSPGEGSTFYFTVVLKTAAQTETYGKFHGIAVSKIRVLLIEPDQSQREHFCAMLGRLDIGCQAVSRVEDAVGLMQERAAADEAFQVVFVSCTQDSPIEGVLDQIGEQADLNSVVMIATPPEWDRVGSKVAAQSIKHVVPKPVFPSALLNSICEVMDSSAVLSASLNQNSASSYDFSHIRLLLVEDVEINREIFIALLEHTGIQIECAENGEEAVNKFCDRPEQYNLIVMDVQMPIMDGYEATRAIRASSAANAATIPVIAMSANVFKEDVDKCLESGMNDHTVKPIDIKDVLKKIQFWCGAETTKTAS